MKKSLLLLTLIFSFCPPSFAQEKTSLVPRSLRPLQVDDLSNAEHIGEVSLSPDGDSIAYIIDKSKRANPMAPEGGARSDLWVADLRDGRAIDLMHGNIHRARALSVNSLRWSPDGARLAFLSRKTGVRGLRLWVWQRKSKRLEQIYDFEVSREFAWVGAGKLVVVKLPEERLSRSIDVSDVHMTPDFTDAAGSRETASVLDSGVAIDIANLPRQELILIDLAKRTHTQLANAVDISALSVAPTGKHIAFRTLVAVIPLDPQRPVQGWSPLLSGTAFGRARSRSSVMIVNTAGATVVPPTTDQFRTSSFCWGRDGESFAFIGANGAERDGPLRVFRGSVGNGIEAVPMPSITPLSVQAASQGRFLVASRSDETVNAKAGSREWWLISQDTPARRMTSKSLGEIPTGLVPGPDGKNFLGIAGNRLWRLDTDRGDWTQDQRTSGTEEVSMVWPEVAAEFQEGYDTLIVAVKSGATTKQYRLSSTSALLEPLVSPSPDAKRLTAYLPAHDVAVFRGQEGAVEHLVVSERGRSRLKTEVNRAAPEVLKGECRLISYRSLNGETLRAALALPPMYDSGKRYPVVTIVYPGTLHDECGLGQNEMRDLLAASGYAVLLPSMPLPGPPGEPYLELANGVMPAVDKAIELGIADPTRLAVMGHSYGGFATYGLVTITTRFRAAIAMAGMSDFTSLYGTFAPSLKYYSFQQYGLFGVQIMETGQGKLGVAPWQDPGRYQRNSPISYADRVKTPVLMIHGDMDSVPMSQAEEFFTSLYRQNKRARFVRYWGEGHVIESSANRRDMWSRIYNWLDDTLDVTRDDRGEMIFDGDHLKSRAGAPVQFTPEAWQDLWRKERSIPESKTASAVN